MIGLSLSSLSLGIRNTGAGTSAPGFSIITAPSYTGTPGGVLTLVPATFSNADSQVDDWLVDGSPVAGATIDSSLYQGQVIQPRSTASKSGESDL